MKGIVCSVCGFIAIDGAAPEKCPVCYSPKKVFSEKDDAIVTPSSATDKVEANKKHIPVILVVKKCGLLPDSGCTDINVKVGEITHPMLPEHFIMYIDCYHDKQFISRIHLTPGKLNPAAGLHLKVSSGKFIAIEKCNLHGSWMTEIEL